MFTLAIFIGIYSYCIFALGILNVLTRINVIIVTILGILIFIYFERKKIPQFFRIVSKRFRYKRIRIKLVYLLIALIVLQALVNLIGALGPELAFDALWYHLTLPKIYLLQHSVYHIPGGLLYYSDMPKLGEMLYVGALAIGNEIIAKLIHLSFGIFILIALYKLSRKFFIASVSLLVVLVFYSNLVVDWESITAYIDLTRTFFEIMALWGFLNWIEQKGWKWLVLSSLMLGLAITTKVLAIGSLIVFVLLFFISNFEYKALWEKTLIINIIVFILIALLVPLPWFIFSFIHTGNPIYPFFTSYFTGVQNNVFSLILLNPLHFFITSWHVLTRASDPISPIYIILLPYIFIYLKKMNHIMRYIFIYVIFSFLFWYMTSSIEGSRMLLPYLPGFTLLCGFVIEQFRKEKFKIFYKVTVAIIIMVSLISIIYRIGANIKYVPEILGRESKETFLAKNLNFHFGDFYDTNNYFKTHIKVTDTVLLYGFHNLYYIDFPFIDNSWVQRGDRFDYIAVQNAKLPVRFKNWQSVYKNDKTLVQLYASPKGACIHLCNY